MQEELETMRPLLEEATVETLATMEQIAADTVSQFLLLRLEKAVFRLRYVPSHLHPSGILRICFWRRVCVGIYSF